MSKRAQHIHWLLQELPALRRAGVLNDEQSRSLQQHYAQESAQQDSKSLIIFGVLGAVLIGIGIILVLAYNWQDLSRLLRTGISLGLLLGAQATVAWALLKSERSVAWHEGSAIFLTLSIGACMALIGQTYHIPGNTPQFLLTWMLLALPIVYLARAHLPAILYGVGLIVWFAMRAEQSSSPPKLIFWALWSLLLPWALWSWRQRPHALGHLYLALVLTLSASIGLLISLTDSVLESYWLQIIPLISASTFLGWKWVIGQAKHWQEQSLGALGALGLLLFGFLGSTQFFWREIADDIQALPASFSWLNSPFDILLLLLLAGLWLAGCVAHVQQRNGLAVTLGVMPAILSLAQWGVTHGALGLVLIGMNLWLLALGVLWVLEGLRENQQGQISLGLLHLAILIFIRFIDADLPLLARGIGFIVVGLSFLITNFALARQLKKGEEHV